MIITSNDMIQLLLTGNIATNFSVPVFQFAFMGSLAARYMHGISGCAFSRRFCATAGGYIGAVPPGSRPGDRIVIFKGAQTPFVLRTKWCASCRHIYTKSERIEIRRLTQRGCCICNPLDNGEDGFGIYELVGECYIHGMMDGEVKVSDDEWESIELV